MEKVNANIIEKIKNVLIVVLIFTTILLLYFLWGNESIEYLIFNNQDNNSEISCTEVILPTEMIFGLGNEDYIVVSKGKEKVWNEYILKTFRKFSANTNIMAEEISADKYKQVIAYPSIIADFSYNMPFKEFCEVYGINMPQGYDGISNIKQLAFSKGSSESAFIYDGTRQKYYRLVGNNKLSLFEEIEQSLGNVDISTFYTMRTFLGEESNNETLIPIDKPQGLVKIPYSPDISNEEEFAVGDMAKDYFGETFDFVRKIEESNGTVIYMYGYGEKVLIFNPNEGSIEYKEEVKVQEVAQTSIFEALQNTLNFISSHGGFETTQGQKIVPYLKSVTSIDDRRSGYKFVFGVTVEGTEVFYGSQEPIIVEVVDGQISYFKRTFININDIDIPEAREVELTAINMLAVNYNYIAETLAEAGILEKGKARRMTFEEVADMIEHLTTGYYKSQSPIDENIAVEGKNSHLMPAWIVKVKNIELYFDLYTGEPIGYSLK